MWVGLLALVTAVSATPLIIPFAEGVYGHGKHGGWLGVPLLVNDQLVNVTVSTALKRTWLIGSKLCESADNSTDCKISRGGVFDISKGGTNKFQPGNPSGSSVPSSPPGTTGTGGWLGQLGTVNKLSLKPDRGSVMGEITSVEVGVFEDAKTAPDFGGMLSLSQMTRQLYKDGKTDSSAVHYLGGYSAETVLQSPDEKENVLIFGGYDAGVIDLNATQQYALGGTDVDRMGLEIEGLTYQGLDMDTVIVSEKMNAVVDTTTPWLWLPKDMVAKLVDACGAHWNKTMEAYVLRRCLSGEDCGAAEENAGTAVLDLKLQGGNSYNISFDDYFMLQSLESEYLAPDSLSVLPVKELETGSTTIVIGRALMAAFHLWVDYDEGYFGLWPATIEQFGNFVPRKIVNWSANDHPPITNSSILAPPATSCDITGPGPCSTTTPTSMPSSWDKSSNGKPVRLGPIVGGSCGAIILLSVGGFFLIRRRRRGTLPSKNTTDDFENHQYPNELDSDQIKLVPSGGHMVEADSHELGPNHYELPVSPQNGGEKTQYPRQPMQLYPTSPYPIPTSPAPSYNTSPYSPSLVSELPSPLTPTAGRFAPHPGVHAGRGMVARGPVYEMNAL